MWERPPLVRCSPERKELLAGFLRIRHACIAEADCAASLAEWANRNSVDFRSMYLRSGFNTDRIATNFNEFHFRRRGKMAELRKSLGPAARIDIHVAQQRLAAAQQHLVE